MVMRVPSFEWTIPVLVGSGLLSWNDGWISPSVVVYTILLGVFLGFMPRQLLYRVVYTLCFALLPVGMGLVVFASVRLSTGPVSDPAPAFQDGNVSMVAALFLYAMHLLFFGVAALAYVSIRLVKRRLSHQRMI